MRNGGIRTGPAAQIAARETEANVMELRLRGTTWTGIAQNLNLSTRGCQKAYARGLGRITVPNPVEAKLELIEQCRRVQNQLWLTMATTTDPVEISALSGRLIQAQQRMSALTGSDVPTAIAIELARGAGPTEAEQVSVDELKSLPVEDLRVLSEIMARAKAGASAQLAIEATPAMLPGSPVEPRRIVKAPPFGDGLDDEPEVQPTAPPVVIDAPPQPRPTMPTARETYARQRSAIDDQIDDLISARGMVCTDGERDPNWGPLTARIAALERQREGRDVAPPVPFGLRNPTLD